MNRERAHGGGYYPHVSQGDEVRHLTVSVAVPVDADGSVPDARDVAKWLRRGLTTVGEVEVVRAADGSYLVPSVEDAWYDDAN